MTEPRHLDNAPITEAVVDFRAIVDPDLPVGSFSAELKADLTETYPDLQELRQFEGKVEFKDEKPIPHPPITTGHGIRVRSSDEKNVAQFRTDGFTFSRLRPYTSWEAVLKDAWDLWTLYIKSCHPEAITRIATRYINKIEVPLPFELDEYLAETSSLPDGVSGTMTSYLTRIGITEPKNQLHANVTQALEPSTVETNAIIILDIDAFKTCDYSVENLDEIYDTLNHLRKLKNEIFFSSITEKAIESLSK